MNINELLSKIKRADIWPVAFEIGAPLWNDEYISRHMLLAHLDETNDKASYNKMLRRQVVKSIVLDCNLSNGDRVLDLGCGPGLYAKEFMNYGVNYTGIDISSQSLGYAMIHKGDFKNNIHYIQGDYTNYVFEKKYDCVIMIWCDFGALSPDMRSNMLKNVYDAMKPGSYFCFDIFSSNSPFKESSSTWRVEYDGFWQKGLYAVLERDKYYETVNAYLHMVITASNQGIKKYNIWDKRYDKIELKKILKTAGFKAVSIKTGGLSKKQFDMLGVYCRVL